jgi:hypothetical protein
VGQITEVMDRAVEVYERITKHRIDTTYYEKLMHIKDDKNILCLR